MLVKKDKIEIGEIVGKVVNAIVEKKISPRFKKVYEDMVGLFTFTNERIGLMSLEIKD